MGSKPNLYLTSKVNYNGSFCCKIDDLLGAVTYLNNDNVVRFLAFIDESFGDRVYCETTIKDIYGNEILAGIETDGTLILEVDAQVPYKMFFLPLAKLNLLMINEVKLLMHELDYYVDTYINEY
jgi:hypothetical protein